MNCTASSQGGGNDIPDNSLYHLGESACINPDIFRYFVIEFCTLTAVVIAPIALLIPTLRSEAKSLMIMAMFAQLMACGLVVSLFAQNGLYEGMVFFNVPWIVAMAYVGKGLIKLAITPTFKLAFHDPTLLLSRFHRINIMANCFFSCIAIAQMVFVRSSDSVFNALEATLLLFIIFDIILVVCTIVYFLQRLENELKTQDTPAIASNRDRLGDFLKKIIVLKKAMIFFICLNGPIGLYPFLLYVAIGTVPYQWLVLVISFHATPFVALSCLHLTQKSKLLGSKSDSSSAANSGGNGRAVVSSQRLPNASSTVVSVLA